MHYFRLIASINLPAGQIAATFTLSFRIFRANGIRDKMPDKVLQYS